MPKWTASHTLIVIGTAILLGLAAFLRQLVTDPTYGPWAAPALAIVVAILGYLGVTSGKGVGGPPGAAAILVLFVAWPLASACTPAQVAAIEDVPGLVLQDLEAGKTLPQIEADVSASIVCPGAPAGSCKTAQEIDAIIDDALVLLTDLGVIPPGILPAANAMHAKLGASRHL